MELSKLQESLLALSAIDNMILPALQSLNPPERLQDDALKFTICNYLQVLLCSFLDEWKVFGSLARDHPTVLITLKVAAPALKRIQSWDGLYKVRSAILAHGFRGKDRRLIWTWELITSQNVPTAYAETILLAECARLSVWVTVQLHRDDIAAAENMAEMRRQDIPDRGIRSLDDMHKELNRIRAVVQSLLGSRGGAEA